MSRWTEAELKESISMTRENMVGVDTDMLNYQGNAPDSCCICNAPLTEMKCVPCNGRRENMFAEIERIWLHERPDIPGIFEETIIRKKKCNKVGVFWNSNASLWVAYIRVDGKDIFLGTHKTKRKAIAARRSGEMKYLGELLPN